MANTVISSANNATVKRWLAEAFRDVRYNTFLRSLMSASGMMPIYELKRLDRGAGDTCTMTLFPTHENDEGRFGSEVLEGFCANLEPVTDSITINKFRHGFSYETSLNAIRLAQDIPAECKAQLMEWLGKKLERLIINTITGAGDGGKTGGNEAISHFVHPVSTYTTVNNITATDLMTPEQISRAAVLARTGLNQSRPAIETFSIPGAKGGDFLLMVVTHAQMRDLKRNSEFMQAVREAQVRGDANPYFSGADAVYDGVIVKAHDMLPTAANTGAVNYAKSFIIGKKGLAWMWGAVAGSAQGGQNGVPAKLTFVELDHADRMEMGATFIAGMIKPRFTLNSVVHDYGVLGVPSAYTALSAATA